MGPSPETAYMTLLCNALIKARVSSEVKALVVADVAAGLLAEGWDRPEEVMTRFRRDTGVMRGFREIRTDPRVDRWLERNT